MRTIVCDGCLKPAGQVRMPAGWFQLVQAQVHNREPLVFHLCRPVCLLEFVNAKGWISDEPGR